METKIQKTRRILKGVVTSDKMQKTIVVRIDRLQKHPKYLKYIKASTKLKAHDETNEAKIGDIVQISETRPYSRDKRWMLDKIVKKASKSAEIADEAAE